jgi:phosphoglycolate phosphatase-like HAD superfamily hydrolase
MRLVIFDIDGTLTQTMKADEECFVRSLAEVCGFRDVDTDWSRYKHATDSGIFHEIHEVRMRRPPSPIEISRFRRHFVGLLAQVSSGAPFVPITGAPVVLSRLAVSSEHRVALATGAWRDSARLKMRSAGLRYDDYPAASSDDASDRESIIRLSMQRAAERYGRFGHTIYVGDGVWDARACRNLGIPFVGIAADCRAARLCAEGAICVFPDFSDTDRFFSSLYETTSVAQARAAANPAVTLRL